MKRIFSLIIIFILLQIPSVIFAQNIIQSSEIIEKVRNGENINYRNVVIDGLLDFSEFTGVEITSEITLANCIFRGTINATHHNKITDSPSPHIIFSKKVSFVGSTFEQNFYFVSVEFKETANFRIVSVVGDIRFEDVKGDVLTEQSDLEPYLLKQAREKLRLTSILYSLALDFTTTLGALNSQQEGLLFTATFKIPLIGVCFFNSKDVGLNTFIYFYSTTIPIFHSADNILLLELPLGKFFPRFETSIELSITTVKAIDTIMELLFIGRFVFPINLGTRYTKSLFSIQPFIEGGYAIFLMKGSLPINTGSPIVGGGIQLYFPIFRINETIISSTGVGFIYRHYIDNIEIINSFSFEFSIMILFLPKYQ